MAVTADCLEHAFPEVGGPYRQRIQHLQTRSPFDATRESDQGECKILDAELTDYASVANRFAKSAAWS